MMWASEKEFYDGISAEGSQIRRKRQTIKGKSRWAFATLGERQGAGGRAPEHHGARRCRRRRYAVALHRRGVEQSARYCWDLQPCRPIVKPQADRRPYGPAKNDRISYPDNPRRATFLRIRSGHRI